MSRSKWAVVALVSVAAAGAAAIAYGAALWSTGTRHVRAALEAGREPAATVRYHSRELEGLPLPVQRFFRAVLTEGQSIASAVSVEQLGTIDMGKSPAQWKPFTAQQRVVTRRPGFDWDARIMMLPGVPVRIRDAYVALHGEVFAAAGRTAWR